MSDEKIIYSIRRVGCPDCGKNRAAEIYCGSIGQCDGIVNIACKCEDPRPDDEMWEELCTGVSEMEEDSAERNIFFDDLMSKGGWQMEGKILHEDEGDPTLH